MRNSPKHMIIPAVSLFLVFLWSIEAIAYETIPVPEYLTKKNIDHKTDPIDIANSYLGIPYRADGTVDESGHFTTFNRPEKSFKTPGMNCSGLVLSLSRHLLGKNYSLKEAVRDRQGDSGTNSPLGKDWDFGWDLIFNLTDGDARRILMPDEKEYSLNAQTGETLRGFPLHDQDSWQKVLSQMSPGHLYLATISKPTNKKGYRLLHYHVALMLVNETGEVWLYHATSKSRTHRMNLKTPQGMNRLMAQFKESKKAPKSILIIETPLANFKKTKMIADEKASHPSEVEAEAGTSNSVSQHTKPSISLSDPIDATPPSRVEKTSDNASQFIATGGLDNATEEADNSSVDNNSSKNLVSSNASPNLEVRHVSGRVYHSFSHLVAHIPFFSDETQKGVKLWFRNRSDSPRALQIVFRGHGEEWNYAGQIPPRGEDLYVSYPWDFGKTVEGPMELGEYEVETRVEDQPWYKDVFEVAVPREALPKIIKVDVPSTVKKNHVFRMKVVAQNQGEESDYGGITVSSPDPSAIQIVSAKPGKIYGKGSTVLSVTSDKIKTKAPMAERWIKLWDKDKKYEMDLKIKALRPGTYPLYVRCAVRSINVKSSQVLMEPPSSEVADQQGFPVYVHEVTVKE